MSELKNLPKIKSFDIEEFDGIKSTIELVDLLDVEKKDFGDGEKELRQVLVKTANLNKDSEKEIRATEYISLKKDENGVWGLADSLQSKANKFMTHFKVEDLEALKGKECLVVKRQGSKSPILGIHHG